MRSFSRWLLLALAVMVLSNAWADNQRPPGWLSGFTKDGREYWYHPDNPRDVRMRDVVTTKRAPAADASATAQVPPQSSQSKLSVTGTAARSVANGKTGTATQDHQQTIRAAEDVPTLSPPQPKPSPPPGLLAGLLESLPSFPGSGSETALQERKPAAPKKNGAPPGHYDAFGNLKDVVPKHAVHEAVTTSDACTDQAKTYVGGVAERYRRCIKKVRKAMQSGAAVDAPHPSSGETPLLASVVGRHPTAIQALLETGAAVDLRHAETGLSALDIAAHQGYADVVEAMLQLKSTAAMRDAMVALAPVDGLAPIHRACRGETRGHAEVRRTLWFAILSNRLRPHSSLSRAGGFCACCRWSSC